VSLTPLLTEPRADRHAVPDWSARRRAGRHAVCFLPVSAPLPSGPRLRADVRRAM